MNILLANDDGIKCEGIQVLAERLSKEHSVFVVAPDGNRSAVSQHLSMFVATKLTEYKENQWACSGFPSDCAFIGGRSNLFEKKIDVVISGINAGGNMGTDIIYSGTCAAARQAVLDGIPGIAVSVNPEDWAKVKTEGWKYSAMADFIAKNVELLASLAKLDYPRMFVNVNGSSTDSYAGVKYTDKICVREYGDSIKIVEENGEKLAQYVMGGNPAKNYDPECDAAVVAKNYISVSRIYVDPMCAGPVDDLEFKL